MAATSGVGAWRQAWVDYEWLIGGRTGDRNGELLNLMFHAGSN